MTVKAFITDLDGTLFLNATTLVPGYDVALNTLHGMGLKIVIFSNRPHRIVDKRTALLPFPADLVITQEDIGIPKGSPRWIDAVCSKFQLNRNELIYIGDSEHDMQTAVNAKIIYFNAEWSNPKYKYGLPLRSPSLLPIIIKYFFMKQHFWYWAVDSKDSRGNPVCARALIKKRDIGVGSFKDDLLNWAKYERDCVLGSLTMSEFVFYHLLGSLYLDGTYSLIDTVAIIPGHTGGHNQLIQNSMERIARLFRETFLPSLLRRHKEAKKSSYTRVSGDSPGFQNQISTMCLDCEPRLRNRVIENKIILVMDDFITEGFNTEWARNLLFNAGAKGVISVAIGAFHNFIEVHSIDKSQKWDSFKPVEIDDQYIKTNYVTAKENPGTLEEIADSYKETAAT